MVSARPTAVKILIASVILGLVVASCGAADDTTGAELGIIGDWELVEGTFDGAPLPMVDGYRITMNVKEDGSLGGTAACNGYGGTFIADNEDFITSEISMTAMGCEPAVQDSESAFLQAIGRPLTYTATATTLTLTGEDVELVFASVAPVPTSDLVGTTWVLDTLFSGDTATSVQGDPATLLLTADGQIIGSTGCRTLSGQYSIGADVVLFNSFSAGGECSAELARQDGHVVTVLGDGFRVNISGDKLTVTASGGEGLGYTAQP